MKHKLSTLVCLLFCYGLIHAQQVVFTQSHKILEYSYAVVDSAGFGKLNDLEKIKYGLKFQEKTKRLTIYDNYDTHTEIQIDSNTHGEEWMRLVSKYRYTPFQTEFIGLSGEVLEIIPHTAEQLKVEQSRKLEMDTAGYHPGIISFPDFRSLLNVNTDSLGFQVLEKSPNEIQLWYPNRSLVFNDKLYTITEEFTDRDGIKTRLLRAYEPYKTNSGFLLKLLKEERFLTGHQGTCITETKLNYYTNYVIQDNGNLIQKALGNIGQVKIYPNPNTGVFTAELILPDSKQAVSCKVVSLQNGQVISIDMGNSKTFLVNQSNLPSGNYVLQVLLNSGQVLSTSFYKN
jgi:hypothetical protein